MDSLEHLWRVNHDASGLYCPCGVRKPLLLFSEYESLSDGYEAIREDALVSGG